MSIFNSIKSKPAREMTAELSPWRPGTELGSSIYKYVNQTPESNPKLLQFGTITTHFTKVGSNTGQKIIRKSKIYNVQEEFEMKSIKAPTVVRLGPSKIKEIKMRKPPVPAFLKNPIIWSPIPLEDVENLQDRLAKRSQLVEGSVAKFVKRLHFIQGTNPSFFS